VLQEGFCPLGDTCPFAHNDFEYWLHHTRWVLAAGSLVPVIVPATHILGCPA